MGYLLIFVFALFVSMTDLAHVYQSDVSFVHHFSALSTSIRQEMFSHPNIPDGFESLDRLLGSEVGARSAVDELSPEWAEHFERVRTTVRSACVKLAILGFPHIVLTFPVMVQVRPASFVFRRWFFLVHQFVLRLYRVVATKVATPITRGWSCSRLDFRRHLSGF